MAARPAVRAHSARRVASRSGSSVRARDRRNSTRQGRDRIRHYHRSGDRPWTPWSSRPGGGEMEKIGAAVWATGHAGRVIVEAGLTRPWLEFRGGIVYDAAKEGLDLGEACGLDVRLGAPVSTDVDAVLGSSGHRCRLLHGHRQPDRGRRRVPAREPRRQGRDHHLRPRPSEDGPGRDRGRRAGRGRACRRWPDPRHRALGLPHDHAAARVALQRDHASTRSDWSGSQTRRCGATASCATRGSAARSRPPAAAS